MHVRRLFIVSPAQLNSRSAAALAGSGVLSRRNRAFSAGQAAMLHVSDDDDGIWRYCCSSSDGAADAALERGREKKSSSSSALTAATVTTTAKYYCNSLPVKMHLQVIDTHFCEFIT